MLLRILNLTYKEFIQFLRDRQMVFFVAVGPTVMLLMVANATASQITHLPMAILDMDHSTTSRELISLLHSVQALKHTHSPESLTEAQELLDRGQVALVIIIPPDLGTRLNNPYQTAQVQLWVDGTNVLVGLVARTSAEQAIRRLGAQIVYQRWPGRESKSPVDLRSRFRFNPELSSSYNAIPGQLSQVVYLVALLISSTSISKERERGTMEQLMVTPFERLELILGKALPVIVLSFLDFVIMLLVTTRLYHIPMRGSLEALVLVTFLLIFAEISWGMIISVLSKNQQQSLLMVFLIAVFDMAFSGYLVAVENMPPLLQWISSAVPIRHYMSALRTIMIKGGGLAEIHSELTALAILDMILLTLAVRNLRRGLD